MASELWVPMPIMLYSSKTGERFILPSPSDIEFMREKISELDSEIEMEESPTRQKTLVQVRDRTVKNIDRVVKQVEDLKSKPETTLHDFYLRIPTLGEFNEAEEASKDWIDGEPRVNENRLSELALSGHVRIGNEQLTVSDIKKLDMQVGRKLWEEMKRLMMPNNARLPFLN